MKRLLMVIALVSVFSATALAGDMPGVNPGIRSTVPTAGSTTKRGEMPFVPGDKPGVGSAPADDAGLSVGMTVLLTLITFLAR